MDTVTEQKHRKKTTG